MLTKISYIIIYISFVFFIGGVLFQLVKKLKSGKFEFNPIKVCKNVVYLNGPRETGTAVWFSAQIMHLGLLLCIIHDIILNSHSADLMPLARQFLLIGGAVSTIGVACLIFMAFIKEALFFYNKLSLVLLLAVLIFMWIAIIDTYNGPGFETISKAMKTFTSDGVPWSVTLSTVTGVAYLGYLVFTDTIKQYVDLLLGKRT